jgi:hypothetical protein
VFGESFYEPLRTTFVNSVREVAPTVEVVEPWSRVRTKTQLGDLFEATGLEGCEIHERVDDLPLASADDWWRIVMGSGLRSTVARLTPAAADEVRARCASDIEHHQITRLTTMSRYALATRP